MGLLSLEPRRPQGCWPEKGAALYSQLLQKDIPVLDFPHTGFQGTFMRPLFVPFDPSMWGDDEDSPFNPGISEIKDPVHSDLPSSGDKMLIIPVVDIYFSE